MTTSFMQNSTLVLNKSWMPIRITTVDHALGMIFNGQAVALDENCVTHNFDSWVELSDAIKGGNRIHTVTMKILVPYVIVLTSYNKVPKNKVRLSRRNIYSRDRGICQYCGKKPIRSEISIDHIVPRSKGGKSEWTNLVLACTPCNVSKSNKMLSETNMKLLTKPEVPKWPLVNTIKLDQTGRNFWERFINKSYWDAALIE